MGLRVITALILAVAVAACDAPPAQAPPQDISRPTQKTNRPAARPRSSEQHPAPRTHENPVPPAANTTTLCDQLKRGDVTSTSIAVNASAAPVYITPNVMATPLVIEPQGTVLPVILLAGEWVLIEFADQRWGPRRGYIHCSNLSIPAATRDATALDSVPVVSTTNPQQRAEDRTERTAPAAASPARTTFAGTTKNVSAAKPEKLAGYVEWMRGDYLIADGQRVRWDAETKVKAGQIGSPHAIPLGYEIDAKGVRLSDGSLLAREIDAKPNGIAAYEREVNQSADDMETGWVREGNAFQSVSDGRHILGPKVVEFGSDVDRVRRVASRLLPPYLDQRRIRVRVLLTTEWNARAAPNGAIWVNKGLLDDVSSDDELACVLGHELAHYTYEHIRRGERNGAIAQLAATAVDAALTNVNSSSKYEAAKVAEKLAVSAWVNGYSRTLEDQADRVGLRYAYEAGYDVHGAVTMWERVRQRFGELPHVINFFDGDHSRPTERIRNIEREIAVNYRDGHEPLKSQGSSPQSR